MAGLTVWNIAAKTYNPFIDIYSSIFILVVEARDLNVSYL